MNGHKELKEEDVEYEGHGNDSDKALVLAARVKVEAATEEIFQGVSVDSSAQLTVVALYQAEGYFREFFERIKPQKSKQAYRFGKKRHSSISTLKIRVPCSETHVILINADVVNVKVSFSLGFDVLTKFKVFLDIWNDVITSLSTNWKMQITRKRAIYIQSCTEKYLLRFQSFERCIIISFAHIPKKSFKCLVNRDQTKLQWEICPSLKELSVSATYIKDCSALITVFVSHSPASTVRSIDTYVYTG